MGPTGTRLPLAGFVSSIALVSIAAAAPPALAADAVDTEIRMLSGTGKDDGVPWELMVSGGRRAGAWGAIPVPSQWELHGFGSYNYGHDGKPRATSKTPRAHEVGQYRRRFRAEAAWRGKRVNLVFDGVMTDAEVKVNGQLAGPVHQGAFYRFEHDVSALLRYGEENVLEVKVSKTSANESVNRAERQGDFWVFGGIFRPVYLEVLPGRHVDRVAIDARHDGALAAEVFLGGAADRDAGPMTIVAQVRTMDGDGDGDGDGSGDGKPVGARFVTVVPPGAEKVTLRTKVRGARAWSAERPHLHRLELVLTRRGRPVHRIRETFGFRTVEVRPHDGLYVNGVKVRLRGVNRHSFWPTSGRTTSPALSEADARLIKEMNMNAVRMSHYPPDAHFLDAADRLGLYVLDELTGWQQKYDTDVGERLVREMVTRDVNHPSVLFWDNGNEGGFNFDLDDDFAKWDPQRRTVLHPWARSGGIDTSHYEAHACCAGTFFGGDDLVMPTEFLHGLYDGGHGAGLADWWDRMVAHPLAIGGFLWAFADEAVVRTDKGGALDTDGNHAADGIVGPYREKEGSFYAIKEIWAPVYLPAATLDRLPATWDGRLRVENRYDFIDLADVRFAWKLVAFRGPGDARAGHEVRAQGIARAPKVPPRAAGELALALPADWRTHDALALTATDPDGREIWTWTWMLATPEELAKRLVRGDAAPVEATLEGGKLRVQAGDAEATFDLATGQLVGAARAGKAFRLGRGPRLVGGKAGEPAPKVEHRRDGADHVVEAIGTGTLKRVRWRVLPSGWLRLDYAYAPKGDPHEHLGVTFDLPDTAVTGMTWLGRGPYRVWKNRTHGVPFDVWRKPYNDTVTGETWQYPEFKGFHADLHWARLDTDGGPITVVSASKEIYLRVLTPRFPGSAHHAAARFPEGDLSFLHGITPIGTKFRRPEEHGPAGGPNLVGHRKSPYEGTIYLRFGEAPRAARAE